VVVRIVEMRLAEQAAPGLVRAGVTRDVVTGLR
jgi:hypothetical protein